jgi:hypothetical protein
MRPGGRCARVGRRRPRPCARQKTVATTGTPARPGTSRAELGRRIVAQQDHTCRPIGLGLHRRDRGHGPARAPRLVDAQAPQPARAQRRHRGRGADEGVARLPCALVAQHPTCPRPAAGVSDAGRGTSWCGLPYRRAYRAATRRAVCTVGTALSRGEDRTTTIAQYRPSAARVRERAAAVRECSHLCHLHSRSRIPAPSSVTARRGPCNDLIDLVIRS